MHLALGELLVHLDSPDPLLEALWRKLFEGWPAADEERVVSGGVDLRLKLRLLSELPPLPAGRPYFVDQTGSLPGSVGRLSVYAGEGADVWLSYRDGGLMRVSLATPGPKPATAEGVAVWPIIEYGRFEDMIFTTLAPLLRRRGYYLIHAFAATRNGRAALLVGRSGSGKTTTGLNLLTGGWHLLANDVVLLQQRPDGVYAWPTPGAISVTAETLELLPALRPLVNQTRQESVAQKYMLAAADLPGLNWGEPAPVADIFFPAVQTRPQSQLQAQSRSVSMVQLMEESVDRWDEPALAGHLNLLEALSRQANCYRLNLGADVRRLPALLAGARGES